MAACAIAIASSLVAFATTGARPYTRFRDKEIERANSETDLSDLFSESGAPQEPPPEAVESRNAIGFLPSGPGLSAISVVTVSVPAIGLFCVMWWVGRRRGRADTAAEATTDPD